MGTTVYVFAALAAAWIFSIGFFVGRIVEGKRHLTRAVTLQDFSKMTRRG